MMDFIKNNWKKILFVFLILAVLIISIIGAFAITISPGSFGEQVIKDQFYNYTFEITYNNATPHNFTIYNITFTDTPYFTFTKIQNLSMNETKTITAFVNANVIVDTNYVRKLTYHYLTDSIASPTIRNIEVKSTGFSPFVLSAVLNDTIVFTNKDTINHTITDIDTSSSQLITPNQTYEMAITELRTYNMLDVQSSTGLTINVSTNIVQTPTKNPSFDISYSFQLKSVYPKTALNLSFTPPKSAMEYDESSLGVFIFRPDNDIFNLHLESDGWATFGDNDFDITSEKIVFFTFTPKNITQTDQTGKSYNKTITITADNIETQELNFNVFLNQHNFTTSSSGGSNTTVIVRLPTLDELDSLCQSVGYNDTFCQAKIKNQTLIVYKNKSIDPNLNEQDVVDFFSGKEDDQIDLGTIKTEVQIGLDDVEKAAKNNTEWLNNLDTRLANVEAIMERVDTFLKNIKTNENARTFGSIVLLIIIVVIVLFVGRKVKAKIQKNRKKHRKW